MCAFVRYLLLSSFIYRYLPFIIILFNRDGTKLTVLVAGTALDALGLLDHHGSELVAGGDVVGAGDGFGGAVLGALAAADALLGVDDVLHEFLADAGAALLVDDVLDVFVPEVVEGAEDGVGRGLAEAAEGAVFDDGGEVAEGVEVVHGAGAVGDFLEEFAEAFVTDAAGAALTAAFFAGELEIELGDGRHARGFVHDDHTAGAHHGACSDEAVVVDLGVEVLGSEAAAGGTAGLHGFELAAVLDAAADLVDDLTQGDAHGDLDQTHVVDLAGQSEHLGSGRLLGTDGAEPVGAFGDDDGDVGEGLDVVDVGGLVHIAAHSGERGLQGGLAALAFHRVDKGGLFAADESTGTVAELDIEVEAAAEDVLAEEAVFAGLLDGDLEAVDGEGIFGTDVDETLGGADGVAADGHSFDDAVGVTLEDGAVHEGAGVTLVGVADDVFLVGLVFGAEAPFDAGGEACAATAAEAGLGDLVDNLLGSHLGQALGEGFVAAAGDAFLDVLGIDKAAVAEGDTDLFAIEVHVLRVADVLFVFGVGVEQLGDLTAFNDVLVDDALDVLRLHLGVEGVVGHNLDDGALLAEAEAAGLDDLNVVRETLLGEDLVEIVDDLEAVAGFASGTAADQNMHFVFCHNLYWVERVLKVLKVLKV